MDKLLHAVEKHEIPKDDLRKKIGLVANAAIMTAVKKRVMVPGCYWDVRIELRCPAGAEDGDAKRESKNR